MVPSVFTVLWFSTFGDLGMMANGADPAAMKAAMDKDVLSALFVAFEQSTSATALVALTTVLAMTFLVTSVDNATYVLAMLGEEVRRRQAVAPNSSGESRWRSWEPPLRSPGQSSVKIMLLTGGLPFLAVLGLQVLGYLRDIRRREP